MLQIACFKWVPPETGFKMPSTLSLRYTAAHVNTLYSMLKRHVRIPFEMVCVTDDPEGIDSDIRTVEYWDKCQHLGGTYNRLYTFSEDMRHIIGERFVCMDLDSVIVGDITHLFERTEDFVINSYQPSEKGYSAKNQLYNGAMYMMTAGARRQVWDSFDFELTPRLVEGRSDIIGCDQAWMREILGTEEARWDRSDGICEARIIKDKLPDDARIVMFSGPRDPSTSEWPWVKQHYQ